MGFEDVEFKLKNLFEMTLVSVSTPLIIIIIIIVTLLAFYLENM